MRNPPSKTLTAPIRRVRFLYIGLGFSLWAAIIVGRLAWLQIVDHTAYMERARNQQQRTFEVAARRGVLYDRNLRELAMTVLVDSVYAVPSEVGDNKASDAELLAAIVHQDPTDRFTSAAQIQARMNASRNFAWVARRLDAETAQRVRELKLKGIYFQKEFQRFYPNHNLAAHVLGYVGTDDDGLGGIERRYDAVLHGQPGHMLTAIDAKRHVLGSVESDPLPGKNLELSLDSNIQYMAQQALDSQMAKVKALRGVVVVQDPHTGQILALAVSPRFDPNNRRHVSGQQLIDSAVSDIYEPGSTFKLVTYSAALDADHVQPTDIIDCQGGAITLFGRTIHDDRSDMGMGRVTVQRALERSSDVAAVKLALRLGPDTFYKYMRAYGFGQRTGIELPSETRGILRPPSRWGATSIGSLAIGQEVGVTPVQLVTMVSTIANGGVYLPPHLVLQSAEPGNAAASLVAEPFRPSSELPSPLPQGAHRVISELTAARMREMMRGIVLEGTGKEAQLNGYSSAGKTGTAQKIDPQTHTYSHTKLVASFAGFAPVSSPAISVTVVIDTPTVGSLYGAAVSAPVFREVAQQVLEYLGVPHDQPVKTPAQMQVAQGPPEPDDVPDQQVGDLAAMFDEVNHLPDDDPLRTTLSQSAAPAPAPADSAPTPAAATEHHSASSGLGELSDKVIEAFRRGVDGLSGDSSAPPPVAPVNVPPPIQPHGGSSVIVEDARRVPVPQFVGLGLREVVEQAERNGLRVQTLGSGLARDQAPAAGTLVPPGTQVVVRFAR